MHHSQQSTKGQTERSNVLSEEVLGTRRHLEAAHEGVVDVQLQQVADGGALRGAELKDE